MTESVSKFFVVKYKKVKERGAYILAWDMLCIFEGSYCHGALSNVVMTLALPTIISRPIPVWFCIYRHAVRYITSAIS